MIDPKQAIRSDNLRTALNYTAQAQHELESAIRSLQQTDDSDLIAHARAAKDYTAGVWMAINDRATWLSN